MAVNASFSDFMAKAVEPLIRDNPDWIRMDGARAGGNREVFASFMHAGSTWKVHSDTHIEPLMIAWGAASQGMEPFVRTATSVGVRLDLRPELQEKKRDPRKRHLYLYQR